MRTSLKTLCLGLVCAAALVLPGCVNHSSNVYSGSQAQTAHTVYYGTVSNINYVEIQNKNTGVGAVGGGVAGGVIGNTMGSGHGRTLATLGGAILGAVAGHAGETALNHETGLEIEVTFDNGSGQVISQSADVAFSVGERVRVLYGTDGSARVTKAPISNTPSVQTVPDAAEADLAQ